MKTIRVCSDDSPSSPERQDMSDASRMKQAAELLRLTPNELRRYLAFPAELEQARRERHAAEARCARLETALRLALDESDLPDGNRARMRQIMKGALSNTAQEGEDNKPRTYVNRRAIDMD